MLIFYTLLAMGMYETEFRNFSSVTHVDSRFVELYHKDTVQAVEVLKRSGKLCEEYTGKDSTKTKLNGVIAELASNTIRRLHSKLHDKNSWNYTNSEIERGILETEVFVLQKQIDFCPEPVATQSNPEVNLA